MIITICLVGDDHLLFEPVLVQFAEFAVQGGESGPGGADLSRNVLLFITHSLQLLILSEHDVSLPEQLSIGLLNTQTGTKNFDYKYNSSTINTNMETLSLRTA